MTLTMTADFALKAYDPTTAEYEILTRLQRDFPRLRVVRKTHRSPKTANPAKGLTYERMEKYIRLHENADELFDLFQKVQSAGRGYPYVKAWFVKQFPNFKNVPDYYDWMYLDGYTPEEIMYAFHRKMDREQAEREALEEGFDSIKVKSEVKLKK